MKAPVTILPARLTVRGPIESAREPASKMVEALAKFETEVGQNANDGSSLTSAVMVGRLTTTRPLTALEAKLTPDSCMITATLRNSDI